MTQDNILVSPSLSVRLKPRADLNNAPRFRLAGRIGDTHVGRVRCLCGPLYIPSRSPESCHSLPRSAFPLPSPIRPIRPIGPIPPSFPSFPFVSPIHFTPDFPRFPAISRPPENFYESQITDKTLPRVLSVSPYLCGFLSLFFAQKLRHFAYFAKFRTQNFRSPPSSRPDPVAPRKIIKKPCNSTYSTRFHFAFALPAHSAPSPGFHTSLPFFTPATHSFGIISSRVPRIPLFLPLPFRWVAALSHQCRAISLSGTSSPV